MDDNIRQRLRADFMRGDVDSLHVLHVLKENGKSREDAEAMLERWKVLKHRQWEGE